MEPAKFSTGCVCIIVLCWPSPWRPSNKWSTRSRPSVKHGWILFKFNKHSTLFKGLCSSEFFPSFPRNDERVDCNCPTHRNAPLIMTTFLFSSIRRDNCIPEQQQQQQPTFSSPVLPRSDASSHPVVMVNAQQTTNGGHHYHHHEAHQTAAAAGADASSHSWNEWTRQLLVIWRSEPLKGWGLENPHFHYCACRAHYFFNSLIGW